MSPRGKNIALLVGAAVGFASIAAIGFKRRSAAKLFRQQQKVAEFEQKNDNVVYLLAMPRWEIAPSVSSPCTKVETFLRIAKISYEYHITDPSVSPTGCLPCIVHKGQRIPDSNAIIEYLTKAFAVSLDSKLTETDKAVGTALVSALSYTTNLSYYRTVFLEASNFAVPYFARTFHVPKPLAWMAVKFIGHKTQSKTKVAGVGHLTQEQFEDEFLRDLESIESVLGNKPFLFGNAPCSLDCAVYALLLPVISMKEIAQVSAPFEFAAQSKTLTSFVSRMTRLAFPDWGDLKNNYAAPSAAAAAKTKAKA